MSNQLSLEEINQKVKQQEDTVAQLVRIVASTNYRISELQVNQEELEKSVIKFQRI